MSDLSPNISDDIYDPVKARREREVLKNPKCPPPKKNTGWIIAVVILSIVALALLIALLIYVFGRSSSSSSSGSNNSLATKGQSCTSNPCATGLTCDAGTCKQRIGTGPCTNTDGSCPGGSTCVDNICKSEYLGSCTKNSDCVSNNCVSGECRLPTTCNTNDDCVGGGGCNSSICVDGECINPVFVGCGDVCDNVGIFCSWPGECVDNICEVKVPNNCVCTGNYSSNDCIAGSACINGLCKGCTGSVCSSNNECNSSNTCQQGVCRPIIGSPCNSSLQCGLCSNGVVEGVCIGGQCTLQVVPI